MLSMHIFSALTKNQILKGGPINMIYVQSWSNTSVMWELKSPVQIPENSQ